MITYPAMLDVPRELVTFLAALLANHRPRDVVRPRHDEGQAQGPLANPPPW